MKKTDTSAVLLTPAIKAMQAPAKGGNAGKGKKGAGLKTSKPKLPTPQSVSTGYGKGSKGGVKY
jgi:hypothetical protein